MRDTRSSTNRGKTTCFLPRTDPGKLIEKSKRTNDSPELETHKSLHRSDRFVALVKPVTPGLLGMNSNRGLTPRITTINKKIKDKKEKKEC
jgi:hypothetical protein